MSLLSVKSGLRAGCALGLFMLASATAHAGGFAIRENSAYGQGTSFAGIASGGALSSMFWNPATMTQFAGVQSEMDTAAIFPYANHTAQAGSTLLVFGSADNSAEEALVPSGYLSYQINPNLWLGMSFNAPFGLSVRFPDIWAGRDYAESSSLRTYNASPSIAYRINDWISVGAGVQLEYAKANLVTGLGATPGATTTIGGTGWGYGFTAGVTLTPTPTTTIGIGYRSAINQKISGEMLVTAALPFTTPGSVSTTLNLPDVISLGIRQRLDPRWSLLGTVEWTNWSRIGTSIVTQPNGAPATILGNNVTLPFQYKDGWFFSAGAEYLWSERLALRAGVGYEISPITDDVRTPRLPDNDRLWLSSGLTWQVGGGMSFDLAYSHLWVRDTNINVGPGNPWFNGAVVYNGNVDAHVDILSLALKIRWDHPKAPVKTSLYTK